MKSKPPYFASLNSLRYIFMACAGIAGLPFRAAHAAVKLPNLYGDHMVLQRDRPVPLHGTAAPGQTVTVTLTPTGGQAIWHLTANADANGLWTVTLPATTAGGPYTLSFSADNTIGLNDVEFGEVWLCSGQSNMAFPLSSAKNADAEIAAADHPDVRFYQSPFSARIRPEADTITGAWKRCTPDDVSNLSAVAYFYGRDLAAQLKVPVGVIVSAVGATSISSWENREALATSPDLRPLDDQFVTQQPNYPPGADTTGWETPGFADTTWTTVDVPTGWAQTRPGPVTLVGAYWLRKSVTIAPNWAGKALTLNFGPIDDGDTTYFNGTVVGHMDTSTPNDWKIPRQYTVPGSLAVPGQAVIAVHITNQLGDGGILGTPDLMSLVPADGSAPAISLSGDWRYQVEDRYPPQGIPTTLYNAMIAPWTAYPVQGVVWYQGEQNTGDGRGYRTQLLGLFAGWRAAWHADGMHFLVVQLPNFKPQLPDPGESQWASLREAQAVSVAATPGTALTVTIDLGEAGNIHPKDKQDVGARLALTALANFYGQPVVCSGPVCTGVTTDGAAVQLQFRASGNSLSAAGGPLQGFAIAGKDGKFAWATATIAGTTVTLTNPAIPSPVAVRYAWADNPAANLTDASGLPAGPFRTDGDTVIPAQADAQAGG